MPASAAGCVLARAAAFAESLRLGIAEVSRIFGKKRGIGPGCRHRGRRAPQRRRKSRGQQRRGNVDCGFVAGGNAHTVRRQRVTRHRRRRWFLAHARGRWLRSGFSGFGREVPRISSQVSHEGNAKGSFEAGTAWAGNGFHGPFTLGKRRWDGVRLFGGKFPPAKGFAGLLAGAANVPGNRNSRPQERNEGNHRDGEHDGHPGHTVRIAKRGVVPGANRQTLSEFGEDTSQEGGCA
jgi:hypothetical protein